MENINWSELGFGYLKTNANVRCEYHNGKWGELELHTDETINIHMAATCLHYGQEAFEGLKAFKGKDGKVRIFRIDENAKRLASSCNGICMPALPEGVFEKAVMMAVKANMEFVPPYESGAALYIRPVLFGYTPQIGVSPAKDYLFIVFVSPVGPYFKGGFSAAGTELADAYSSGTLNGGHVRFFAPRLKRFTTRRAVFPHATWLVQAPAH